MKQPRQCNFCVLAEVCPKYQEDASCAYGLPVDDTAYNPVNNAQVLEEYLGDLLRIQQDRIMQLYLEEKAEGSGASKDLTANIKLSLETMAMLREAMSESQSFTMKAKGPGVIDMFRPRGH